MSIVSCTLFALAVAMAPLRSLAQEVYFNDFDGGETLGAGVSGGLSGETTTEPVQGYAGEGPSGGEFGGNLLRNDSATQPGAATVLTLDGLPAHGAVSVEFLLAVIDSWDGNGPAAAPDFFEVWIDGVSVFQETFSNTSNLGQTQTYAGPAIVFEQDLGWTVSANHNDSAYDMAPNLTGIRHTESTLTLELFAAGAGWQGADDESWGIDNLRVAVEVPEPAQTRQLLAGALVLLLAAATRKT